jgi:hypothetical protein
MAFRGSAMKKIDFGQTISLFSNIGILIGIGLLIYELNQNRAMTAAEIRNSIAQTTATLIRDEAMNKDILEVSMRGLAGEPLEPLEQEQFELFFAAYFRMWENANYQYRVGLYDAVEYESQRGTWLRLLETPGLRRLWCSRRGRASISPPFAAEIDNFLGDAGCE